MMMVNHVVHETPPRQPGSILSPPSGSVRWPGRVRSGRQLWGQLHGMLVRIARAEVRRRGPRVRISKK